MHEVLFFLFQFYDFCSINFAEIKEEPVIQIYKKGCANISLISLFGVDFPFLFRVERGPRDPLILDT